MGNVLEKVKKILVGDDEFDDDFEGYEDEEMQDEMEEEIIEPVIPGKKNSTNNKVVNIHTSASAKIIISKPMVYDDAMEICDSLKNRKIVVINTSAIENKIAQRLLDFVSGSCYALGGELQEISKGVYLLSPSNVEVTSELKNELSSKALFNFIK